MSPRLAAPRGLPPRSAGIVVTALLLAVLAVPAPAIAQDPGAARFLGEPASATARQVADRAVSASDNRDRAFIVIDKALAQVFLFDRHGQLQGATRALLGSALGDNTVPGIGDRRISSIRPEERTTPAGRFVATMGHDPAGRTILWVDYASAIALHRVVTANPKERRLQRLVSGSASERRISYGCINVPVEFFERQVTPAFTGTGGIVYIIPETRSVGDSLLSSAK